MSSDYLTLQEVADLLRVSKRTIEIWIDSEYLSSVSLPFRGRRVRLERLRDLLGLEPGEALPELYTVQEVVDLLRVSKQTLTTWLENGSLDGLRLPSGWRLLRRETLERLLRMRPGSTFPDLLTRQEVQDLFKVSEQAFLGWITEGIIKEIRLPSGDIRPGPSRIKRSTVERLVGIHPGEQFPEILTSREAADLLGISQQRMVNSLRRGQLVNVSVSPSRQPHAPIRLRKDRLLLRCFSGGQRAWVEKEIREHAQQSTDATRRLYHFVLDMLEKEAILNESVLLAAVAGYQERHAQIPRVLAEILQGREVIEEVLQRLPASD